MDRKLTDKLNKRKEEGTLRSLSSFSGMIDFHSNDYLGLSVVETISNVEKFGGTGSRLISGNSEEVMDAERVIANYFVSPSALFFNSGYDANLGFFSSVPQRGDTVIFDESIHASVRDGIRLSFASSFSFAHNDLEDLSRKLSNAKGATYVAVESLYSMGGDLAPLVEICDLCERFGAYLIVDEAHAAGVFGGGKGICFELGLEDRIFARLVTFGKAFGSHGATFLCSESLKTYLINFSRSFIYTTSLPSSSYTRVKEILKIDLTERQHKLSANIEYFRSLIDDELLFSDKRSPIQILRVGDRKLLKKAVARCLDKGLAVKAVFAPTVKISEECIRISLHSDLCKDQIDLLAKTISSILWLSH